MSDDIYREVRWSNARLLTIIAERLLLDRILHLCEELGIHAHTITECEGRGSRGLAVDEAHGDNVEIRLLAARPLLDALARRLRDRYFEDHSIILYAADVEVLRSARFGGGG